LIEFALLRGHEELWIATTEHFFMALPSFLLIFALIILSMVMKKTIFLFIAVILLLSCSTRGRYSARLVAADSLMNAHPDSAYAILKSISSDTLPSKADRAYYALLFTQAMYKNYDTIRSDSLINIAVNFFSDNHDREKYTRSLIYKGAALSNMGNKLDAMESFLRAEENADKSDVNNLGLSEVQLAVIYQDIYVDVNVIIDKYKKALHYYKLAGNKKNQLLCLCQIGGLFRINNIDSAFTYLRAANNLAKEIGDSVNFYNSTELLARAYEKIGDYQASKSMALSAINSMVQGINLVDCYCDASVAYANIGDVKQSLFYYDKFNSVFNPSSIREKVLNLVLLREIEKARGNFKLALAYYVQADSIYDSITQSSEKSRLTNFEDKYKRQKSELDNSNIRQDNLSLLVILLCVIVLLLLATFFIYYLHNRLVERTFFCDQLSAEAIASHEELLKKIHSESRLRKTMVTQIEIIRKLINSCNNTTDKTSKIFVCEFKEAMRIKNDKSFWTDLRFFIDENYNNIISRLSANYPKLNDDDINFISLICCGFSYIEIAICLGYSKSTSAAVRKRRIAVKMGLNCTLDKFINEILN
jgi:hypothetical protein